MGATKFSKFLIATGLVAAGLAGGTVAASDYPPDVPPSSTVLTSTQEPPGSDSVIAVRSAGQLPETGSDSMTIATIAGGALVAGVGLVVVARRRRGPAPA